ncbi:MAG TPA: KilA-N domain-containing protein [Abditibacterium sp.]|jgi:hypothetical protein
MTRIKKNTIEVQGTEIAVLSAGDDDFISLTDIARSKNSGQPDDLIRNWLRNRNTLEFVGLWETLNNPSFNPVEWNGFKMQAGLNSFALTPKQWIEKTGAVGISSKTGRYGGTFAHQDIAFEFATWISVEFKLYLIKEFQRLKTDETRRLNEGEEWNLNRTLSKLNYQIHTDAIKTHLIPALTAGQISTVYAVEADVLNVALFGQTAREWRDANPTLKGNLRDYATVAQLLVMTNLESINAELIGMGLSQSDRLRRLNQTAITQLKTLASAAQRLASPPGKPKGTLE